MAEKRFTGSSLASKIGVCNNTVSRWINGISVPAIEKALSVKGALGLTDQEFAEIFLPEPSQIRNN
jgi:transcriptional regulator with XRE-family HTH domain